MKNGVGLTCCSMGMASYVDGPADGSGLSAVGEIRLIPDLSTKCRLPWYLESFLRQFYDLPLFNFLCKG